MDGARDPIADQRSRAMSAPSRVDLSDFVHRLARHRLSGVQESVVDRGVHKREPPVGRIVNPQSGAIEPIQEHVHRPTRSRHAQADSSANLSVGPRLKPADKDGLRIGGNDRKIPSGKLKRLP